jgi:hypothetical protein
MCPQKVKFIGGTSMIGLCIGKIGYLTSTRGKNNLLEIQHLIQLCFKKLFGFNEVTVNKDPIKALEKKPVTVTD